MDRQQAIAMLKELVNHHLIDPTYVSIGLRKPNYYQIQFKCDFNRKEIEEYAEKNSLTIEEDKEKNYLLIFKQ